MRKPALYLAAALFASLLAASAVTSILSLAQARRAREQLLLLNERLAELSAGVRLAAAARPANLPPPAPSPAPQPPATLPSPAPPLPARPPALAPEPAAPPMATPMAAPPAASPATDPIPPAPETDLALQQELASGLRCFEQTRYAEASTRFAVILARQPENTQVRLYYAASLYRANPGASDRYAEIERHLQQVLREQPENVQALELLGRVRAERERWSDALGFFQRALELRPEDLECLRMAGLCAFYGGDPEAAVGYFLQACSLNEAAAEPWHLLALARERAGQPEEAADAYLRCLELDPDFQQARLRAGLVLLKLGRHRKARELLQEHVRKRPGVEALAALGDCCFALGETQQAEALWRRALEKMIPAAPREKREAAELYLRLSRAAWQRQAGEQSLALAEQGMLCEPLPLLRAFQGLGCLATGEPVRGRALLLALLEEHPGSEAASLAAEALERESP